MPGDPAGMPGTAILRRSSRLLIDLLGGHVTFNKLSIDHCCVAGRESWSDTEILLDRAHVGFYMINDGEAVGFKVLNPFLAASAVCISMNIDCQCLLLERLNR
jgi:hypothetical protein